MAVRDRRDWGLLSLDAGRYLLSRETCFLFTLGFGSLRPSATGCDRGVLVNAHCYFRHCFVLSSLSSPVFRLVCVSNLIDN